MLDLKDHGAVGHVRVVRASLNHTNEVYKKSGYHTFIHKVRDVISHINFLSIILTFHLDVISDGL